MKQKKTNVIKSSFRDPSGFLFRKNNILYRQINKTYADDYNLLMSSGLYEKLNSQKLLIPHIEIKKKNKNPDVFRIIKPEKIPFISYPYEWSFSGLKAAATTTLKIQRTALEHGMSLKDANAYNIQFINTKPILIDTLSFEKYKKGRPWFAYKQFCQHFLAPLALMKYTNIDLNKLAGIYIDGIPLSLASKLLPLKTKFNIPLFLHIHLHAKSQKQYSDTALSDEYKKSRQISELSLKGLIDSLLTAVTKLKYNPNKSHWTNYYNDHNYHSKSFDHKLQLVKKYIQKVHPKSVWDMGANTGVFSRLTCEMEIPTIAFDLDPEVVEINYLECSKNPKSHVLPLTLDLTNPSPNIGWANEERMTLEQRGPADVILALALIHHLSISNNIPFAKTAEYFSKLCNYLIIEFVPKEDSQVIRLLSSREDIFPDYKPDSFKKVFKKYFRFIGISDIKETKRTLYLMKSLKK